MKALRLALASDTFLPQVNGVARTLGVLVRELVRRGAEVRVFTTTDPNAVAASDITRFPSVAFWAYPQLRMAAPGARLQAELRAWRPTLVHAATPFGVGLAARAAAKSLGIRFVTSYHASLSAYAKFYQLGALAEPGWNFLRWFHNSGAMTFVPSPPVADELAARGFTSLRLWSRGVDGRHFNPRHRSL
ncbi:MAG: glycosyltransferase, partial [Gemmatimonadaceae bacterium]